MKLDARFNALETGSGSPSFDQLSWSSRLWQAFQLGVSRRLERYCGPND